METNKQKAAFKKPVYFVINEWQATALSDLSLYLPSICLGLEYETELAWHMLFKNIVQDQAHLFS